MIIIIYVAISNKPVNQCYLNKKHKNQDFTVQCLSLGREFFDKKIEICTYVKHFGKSNVCKMFEFVNSQRFVINNEFFYKEFYN